MNKIFWAADSTVQTNDFTTYPQTGIGQVFPLFVKNEYQVVNHAKNGRSTKSFMDEGRLKAIEEQIGAGDFLFIQFGHNDEKKEDPTRYTEPFSTYMENLETFIKTARDHSAYPVLITPLERRCFMDEKHLGIGAHSDYVAAMKQTAEKNSRRWYMFFPEGEYKNHPEKSEDNTHLRYDGAVDFASLIARGLKEIGGVYAEMLLDDMNL